MGPALERMILVVTLMVWVWFEGHTQLFICCLKLASVTRGAMPCQTHEWAIGASIRSFFLNSLGERQDPSFFFIFLFASCLQLAPVTRVKPCQTHEWAFGASWRHSAFLLFLYFFCIFGFFYDFYVSITPPTPPGLRLPSENPYLPPSTDNRDTGKTLPDPQVGIGASVKK